MDLLLYRSMERSRTCPVPQGTCGIRQGMEKSLQNGKRILFFSFFYFRRLISTFFLCCYLCRFRAGRLFKSARTPRSISKNLRSKSRRSSPTESVGTPCARKGSNHAPAARTVSHHHHHSLVAAAPPCRFSTAILHGECT